MTALAAPSRFNRASVAPVADWLTAAVALALPWSTSAAGVLIALWLVTALASSDPAALRRELLTPAGGLPVLLWCLGAVGMLWADVDWHARFSGLGSFHKLLMMPLLLAQFRRSERGGYVIACFFASSTIVMIVSFVLVFAHMATRPDKLIGIPVHDDIFQNTEFLVCAFGALGVAFDRVYKRRWAAALSLFAIAGLFLVNLAIVVFSRIALAAAPAMVLLFGWRLLRWKGILVACIATVVLGGMAWLGSPNFRDRIYTSASDVHLYHQSNAVTDIGTHLAFLRESFSIIATAPLAGHGTGSIPEQFRRVTAGQTGAWAVATDNPHNQTFAVAIQLGLVGCLALWAMWIAQLRIFHGDSIAAWFGLVVVVQNIVFSTVHSHLFDFENGWLYVFAVGVLGGIVLKEEDAKLREVA